MQETEIKTLPPDKYDWGQFADTNQAEWCRDHLHFDGKPFDPRTLSALIHRPATVGSGEGRKTREIILAALAEGLIHEEEAAALDKAA